MGKELDVRLLPDFGKGTVTSCYVCPLSGVVDKFDDLMCAHIGEVYSDDDSAVLRRVPFESIGDTDKYKPIISGECRLPKLVDGVAVAVVGAIERAYCPHCRKSLAVRAVNMPLPTTEIIWCEKCKKTVEPKYWRQDARATSVREWNKLQNVSRETNVKGGIEYHQSSCCDADAIEVYGRGKLPRYKCTKCGEYPIERVDKPSRSVEAEERGSQGGELLVCRRCLFGVGDHFELGDDGVCSLCALNIKTEGGE